MKHGKSAAGRSAGRVKRVELQKQDLAAAGREAVQARGEFNAGGMVPKHTHPDEEMLVLLQAYAFPGMIVR